MPDRPMTSRVPWESSIGSVFHSLHATSQALQPMHTEVSVKKPTRFGWSGSYPASSVTSGRGPNSRFCGSLPVKAGLAELIVMPASSSPRASRSCPPSCRRLAGGRLDRRPSVDAHRTRGHSGPAAVGLHELEQLGPARPAAGDDVGGADLVLLDVRIRIQHDA